MCFVIYNLRIGCQYRQSQTHRQGVSPPWHPPQGTARPQRCATAANRVSTSPGPPTPVFTPSKYLLFLVGVGVYFPWPESHGGPTNGRVFVSNLTQSAM